jgi:hypothetical protein
MTVKVIVAPTSQFRRKSPRPHFKRYEAKESPLEQETAYDNNHDCVH